MSRQTLELAIRNRNYSDALRIAEALYDASRPDPDIGAMHGHVLQQLGHHAEASAVLKIVARSRPALPSVWIDLANASMALNDWPAAEQALAKFRALAPDAAAGWFAQGQIALASGALERAEAAFLAAARKHPAWIERRLVLGNQAFDGDQFELASRHYRACLALLPNRLDLRLNLVSSLTRAGQFDEALSVARDSVARFPAQPRLLQRYSQLLDLVAGTSVDERIDVRQHWIKCAPESALAHYDLANALIAIGDNASAHRHYALSTKLAPDQPLARWTAMHMPASAVFDDDEQMQAFASHWRHEMSFFEHQFELRDADTCMRMIASCANFSLAYLGEDMRADDERHAAFLKRLGDRALLPRPAVLPAAAITHQRPRRVGIVSAHFRWHSVSRVLRDLFLALDPNKIELICFDLDGEQDESTAAWRARAHHYIDGHRDILGWHQVLIDTPVDVLIFLDLGMHPVSGALATQRYAPVQCTSTGHPMTSGAKTIDYFLSSAAAEAPQADAHYTEQLVRLPGLAWSYRPTPKARDAVPAGAFIDRGDRVGYYCAQNGAKLVPGHDKLFARILERMPSAILALTPKLRPIPSQQLQARIERYFVSTGLHPATCLQMFPALDYDGYISLLERSDVVLDTLWFSGGLTSLDALSRDIPIVTLPGRLLRSRQTMAMLKLLELDELIARDENDYVAIAVRLGSDTAWRRDVSAQISERKHRLYEYAEARDALQDFLLNVGNTKLRR